MANSYARKLITRFENAVRNHEMKGAMHPDEHEEIQRDYDESRARLVAYVDARKAETDAARWRRI